MYVPGPDSPREREMAAEMEGHLAALAKASNGDARRELEGLYLLAVEREQLAVVSYGGPILHARVERLQADLATREVVARALRWAARDERTHLVLAHHLLARTGRLATRLVALAGRAGGLVAGWSAAVLQHTTLRSAPLSRAVARLVSWVGKLAGKVPKAAESALSAGSFHDFCAFQVGAERTAAMSWEHLARRLRAMHPDPRVGELAARIASDEHNHERVVRLLRDAFDDRDQLQPGFDSEVVRAELERIDPSFVGAPGEGKARAACVGRGGVVHVRERDGAKRGEREAIEALFRETVLETGLLDRVLEGAPARPRVAVNTSFMMAYDRADPSSWVDLGLTSALVRELRARGASDVALLEAPNHYDLFFEGRSVPEVARYVGLEGGEAYRVVDASTEHAPHRYRRGVGQHGVSATWRDADVRIALGKLRSNPSHLVHLTLNSLESLGRRVDELLFADRQGDLATGLVMLLDEFPPDLALLDATHHAPNGLTGILGDPTPSHPGRLYASLDPLALDLVAARHMGIERFPAGSVLAVALDWFDDPRDTTLVDGVDAPITDFDSPQRNDLTVLLSSLAYPVYQLGGDRGSWWVPRMDPAAFPARPASLVARAVRPVLRAAFGFGRPPRGGPDRR